MPEACSGDLCPPIGRVCSVLPLIEDIILKVRALLIERDAIDDLGRHRVRRVSLGGISFSFCLEECR